MTTYLKVIEWDCSCKKMNDRQREYQMELLSNIKMGFYTRLDLYDFLASL